MRERPTVALCFLCWNERPGCERDVPPIDLSAFDEVFAIDGRSSDGTAEYLQSLGVRTYAQNVPGLNSAYWQAVELTRCDCIVVFFPKGTLPVEILYEFRAHFSEGKELVIASRMAPGGRCEEDGGWWRPRKWGVRFLAALASGLWRREGPRISDVLHGVKGFSVRAFRSMSPSREGLSIDLEMAVRSYRQRLPRAEFPVTEGPRLYGETRFKILPTGWKLLRSLLREARRPAFD